MDLYICIYFFFFFLNVFALFKIFGFFGFVLDNFFLLLFFSKLLRLLLKGTNVTTEHQKWPKMCQNSIMSRPKPSAGARSRPG